MKSLFLITLVAALPALAFAARPEPARSVPVALYSGRWYEIARTPNLRERGCKVATSEFSGVTSGDFTVTETCRHVSGEHRVSTVRAALVPGSNNARFRMSMLGGLVHPEFWILDAWRKGRGHGQGRRPRLSDGEAGVRLTRQTGVR
jgi:apolipoprotein D and lipocalin family protein